MYGIFTAQYAPSYLYKLKQWKTDRFR